MSSDILQRRMRSRRCDLEESNEMRGFYWEKYVLRMGWSLHYCGLKEVGITVDIRTWSKLVSIVKLYDKLYQMVAGLLLTLFFNNMNVIKRNGDIFSFNRNNVNHLFSCRLPQLLTTYYSRQRPVTRTQNNMWKVIDKINCFSSIIFQYSYAMQLI